MRLSEAEEDGEEEGVRVGVQVPEGVGRTEWVSVREAGEGEAVGVGDGLVLGVVDSWPVAVQVGVLQLTLAVGLAALRVRVRVPETGGVTVQVGLALMGLVRLGGVAEGLGLCETEGGVRVGLGDRNVAEQVEAVADAVGERVFRERLSVTEYERERRLVTEGEKLRLAEGLADRVGEVLAELGLRLELQVGLTLWTVDKVGLLLRERCCVGVGGVAETVGVGVRVAVAGLVGGDGVSVREALGGDGVWETVGVEVQEPVAVEGVKIVGETEGVGVEDREAEETEDETVPVMEKDGVGVPIVDTVLVKDRLAMVQLLSVGDADWSAVIEGLCVDEAVELVLAVGGRVSFKVPVGVLEGGDAEKENDPLLLLLRLTLGVAVGVAEGVCEGPVGVRLGVLEQERERVKVRLWTEE